MDYAVLGVKYPAISQVFSDNVALGVLEFRVSSRFPKRV